jgi:NADH-quinone oxidoreductase subunit L
VVGELTSHGAATLWLIPAIPLAVAMFNLFLGARLGRWAGWLATLAVFASLGIALVAVRDLLTYPDEERLALQHLFDWISVGGFRVGADLRLDTLSATMILVVTAIGALIHLFSIGYMAEDPRRGRFFAYLNLFVFFMLMLVMGANYLVLYLGWEGVGLCSFLLIGFWFDKVENAEAAKKAFITTRIGDTLMLIGLALLVFKFGTLDFEPIFGTAASVLTKDGATVIALLLFAGAIGKSAQIPLQVWLPDAMAGPTPVSALIHAATMVTAGVYLVIRSHVLFEISGTALTIVLIVGLATAFFAATCAMAQVDIKRVLAYSTISQLGYMFIAVGMRAYAVALFFLVAHAFYKGLMFLGSGSVIHGMRGEQDMRRMGGLRMAMPITFVTFVVGGLAQAGVPPLAGFFAKDAILEVANHTGRQAVYVLATITAFLTAFYIGRMLIMTFFGAPRSDEAAHAHESPAVMWVPLAILALGIAMIVPLQTSPEGTLSRILDPVVGAIDAATGLSFVQLAGIAVVVSLLALAVTWWIYGSRRADPVAFRARMEPWASAAQHGWYVDRAYDVVFVQPAKAFARMVGDVFDVKVIDGAVNGIGALVKRVSTAGRLVQTGFVRTYALVLFLGAVAILGYIGVRS